MKNTWFHTSVFYEESNNHIIEITHFFYALIFMIIFVSWKLLLSSVYLLHNSDFIFNKIILIHHRPKMIDEKCFVSFKRKTISILSLVPIDFFFLGYKTRTKQNKWRKLQCIFTIHNLYQFKYYRNTESWLIITRLKHIYETIWYAYY